MPWSFSARDYGRILRAVMREVRRDNVSVIAAGVAYFSTLAIFPLITALISLFGYFADPMQVQAQLEEVSDILPPEAWDILDAQVMAVVSAPSPTLGLGIFVSLLMILWSAGAGIRAMMRAMNIAYDVDENRSFLKFSAEAVMFTLSVGIFMVLAMYVIVYMPVFLQFMHLDRASEEISLILPWLLLIGYFGLAAGLLYRYGPSRENAPVKWVLPGVIFATLTWLIISASFSYFVARFGTYNRVYGSLSAIIVLQVWIWLTAQVIIIGAEVNAEIEDFAVEQLESFKKHEKKEHHGLDLSS